MNKTTSSSATTSNSLPHPPQKPEPHRTMMIPATRTEFHEEPRRISFILDSTSEVIDLGSPQKIVTKKITTITSTPHNIPIQEKKSTIRCSLSGMHNSLYNSMLHHDESTSSMDFPPSLPSRCTDEDDDDVAYLLDDDDGIDVCCPNELRGSSSLSSSWNHCDSIPVSPIKSCDSRVRVVLPGSPIDQRAILTFSRSISDLPRAGESRRNRIVGRTSITTTIDSSRTDNTAPNSPTTNLAARRPVKQVFFPSNSC